MSTSDLSTLVQKVDHLATQASNSESSLRYDELALSDGVRTYQISGAYTTKNLEAAPEKSTEVSYTFYNADAAISRVSIDLHHYRRAAYVEGTDEARVEALAEFIAGELRQHETFTGGLAPRFAILLLLVLLVFTALRRGTATGLFVSMFAMIAAFFLGSSSSFLPGVVIYQGEASLLVRFAPQITFASCILAVVAAVVALTPLVVGGIRKWVLGAERAPTQQDESTD